MRRDCFGSSSASGLPASAPRPRGQWTCSGPSTRRASLPAAWASTSRPAPTAARRCPAAWTGPRWTDSRPSSAWTCARRRDGPSSRAASSPMTGPTSPWMRRARTSPLPTTSSPACAAPWATRRRRSRDSRGWGRSWAAGAGRSAFPSSRGESPGATSATSASFGGGRIGWVPPIRRPWSRARWSCAGPGRSSGWTGAARSAGSATRTRSTCGCASRAGRPPTSSRRWSGTSMSMARSPVRPPFSAGAARPRDSRVSPRRPAGTTAFRSRRPSSPRAGRGTWPR